MRKKNIFFAVVLTNGFVEFNFSWASAQDWFYIKDLSSEGLVAKFNSSDKSDYKL